MSNTNLIQNYLANLEVLNIKLHNIHWNVVGKQFMLVHNFTEEIYEDLFKNLDEVAELLKTKNIRPLSTVLEFLEVATIKEVKVEEFTVDESLKTIKEDLELMRDLALRIRKSASDEDEFDTTAMFEEYISYYDKKIWFLTSMLK